MSYYRTCPDYGAHLDPVEMCNCREELLIKAFNLLCKLDNGQIQYIMEGLKNETSAGAK